MQIVIDIPKWKYEEIICDKSCGLYTLTRAIAKGTVLPDNPTNGEVIQALFPNIYEGFSNVIDLNLWWYAKYKAKEQEK